MQQIFNGQSIIDQLVMNSFNYQYDMKTVENFNMDCLKSIFINNNYQLGIFHSSIEQPKQGYNALYLAESSDNKNWIKKQKLSTRGSQGTIYQIPLTLSFLVLYELQNHQKGNTIAVRYYESLDKLRVNNFLYEYQLQQINSQKKVVNLGTPSVDSIQLIFKQSEQKYSQYKLNIKYHYSPDGSHDLPGYGFVHLIPLRDFVDKKGDWIGGCKEVYTDWIGKTDDRVLTAIRKIGIMGKIGQRDLFEVKNNSGTVLKYYLYEVNLYQAFDWKNWRIILYSQLEGTAQIIPFQFDLVIDLANPHISFVEYDEQLKLYKFWLSFFIPSEGVRPGTNARPGQFTALTKLQI